MGGSPQLTPAVEEDTVMEHSDSKPVRSNSAGSNRQKMDLQLLLYNVSSTESTSFRVRIALNLKNLSYESRTRKGLEVQQNSSSSSSLGLVPTLVDGDTELVQSLAIMEYLEETFPERPLLPKDHPGRARVRAIALMVACEIAPLNNKRTSSYLAEHFVADEAVLAAWRRHWIEVGFTSLERMLQQPATRTFCHGDQPTMADCCLVPQVYNALTTAPGLDLNAYPTVRRIYETCLSLHAFSAALPEKQVDGPGAAANGAASANKRLRRSSTPDIGEDACHPE